MALSGVGGGHQNLIGIIEYEETPNKYRVPAVKGLLGASSYWTQEEAENVVGDGAADGTSLLTITIPANYHCIGVAAISMSNLQAIIRIGIGDLGDPPTTHYWISCPTPLEPFGAMAEETTPVFVVASSASAQTLRMWVPQTGIAAIATNNDVNHYFYGFLGVLLIKDPIA